MDLQWWVLLLCSCMYVCMQRPRCCLPGLCRGLWKTHRVTQRGYVQPRLLQKLNCHAEEDVSRTENRNNEKPHERLRKEQQWCGNGNAKLTAAAANWAVVAAASSQKKKKDKHTIKHECWPGIPQKVLRRRRWFSGVGRHISGFVSFSSSLNLGFVERRCWV